MGCDDRLSLMRSPGSPTRTTSDPTEIRLLRIALEGEQTRLSQASGIMVDKVTTTPRATLGDHIGAASDTTMLALSRALVAFLGTT